MAKINWNEGVDFDNCVEPVHIVLLLLFFLHLELSYKKESDIVMKSL